MRKREMERKRERRKEMPRYTGSRSYRLFLYPEQIIFFVFQRAARLVEALIVTALLSYGSGKLRTVKAFLRQAASRNPPRRFAQISGTCRVLTRRSKKTGLINVDFLTTYITFYFIYFLSYTRHSSPCISHPLSSADSWILNLRWTHSQRIR